MTCKNCGAQLAENAAFCPVCGTKQEAQIPVAPPTIGVPVQDDNISAPPLGVQDAQPAQFSQPTEPVPAYGAPVSEAPQPTSENPPVFYTPAPVQNQAQTPPVYTTPAQQMPQYTQAPVVPNGDQKSTGLNVLSFFIPLVGIIMYFVNRKEKPIRSKSNLKSALIGLGVQVVSSILIVVLCFSLAFGMFKTISSTPGAHVTINGEEFVIGDDGEKIPVEEYDDWWEDVTESKGGEADKEEPRTNTSEGTETSTAPSETTLPNAHSVPQISGLNNYKTICVNGKILTLPMKYSDFMAAMEGFSLGRYEDPDLMLKQNQYSFVGITRDGYSYVGIYIMNNDAETKKLTDCYVGGINIETGLSDDKNADVQILGISLGDKFTAEDLEKVFGEPNYSHDYKSELTDTTTMEWEIPTNGDSWQTNSVEIVIDNSNGTIDEITLKAMY